MYVVFLGPPGAGKGTYAAILAEIWNVKILATGDMLRAEIEMDTELGRITEKYIKAGELVPDDVMEDIVQNTLDAEDAQNGVIFDGFPRTVAQAYMLDDVVRAKGETIKLVIELQTPDEEIITRLSNRRVCPKCGRIYHMINTKPKVDEICDDDGEKLIHREDDKPDTIRNRLEVYHRQTAPILQHFKSKENLKYIIVDTSGLPENGRENMLNELRRNGLIYIDNAH